MSKLRSIASQYRRKVLGGSWARGSIINLTCDLTFQQSCAAEEWLAGVTILRLTRVAPFSLEAVARCSHFLKHVHVEQRQHKHKFCKEPRDKSCHCSFGMVAILALLLPFSGRVRFLESQHWGRSLGDGGCFASLGSRGLCALLTPCTSSAPHKHLVELVIFLP